MTIRAALLALICLATPAAAQEPATAARTEPRRPNVVLILADDLGYGDIGVHGCTDIKTPNIDSLARDGVRCTNAYASGPRCAPTRAGLVTGRYQERFGCEIGAEQGLPASETTLVERLRQAGYATGLVGKWHLGRRPTAHPLAHGFDEFFGFLAGDNPSLPRGADGVVPNVLRGREPASEKEYLTDAFAREAVSFVERHADGPFFLYLAFGAPHLPLEAPAAYLERCASITDPTRRTYAAMVTAMDDAIGRVLAALHARGLDESTLVFFVNDNGGPHNAGQWNGSSNSPLRGQKGGTLEGGIRVPFLARWPGALAAGRTYDAPVSTLDLLPTALGVAGVALDPEWKLDGVDLLPYLAGRATGVPHEVLYWAFRTPPDKPAFHKWAIRRGDLKLVHVVERVAGTRKLPEAAQFGLYDVAHDPGETKDLLAEKPEVAKELGELWQRWCAELPPVPVVKRKQR